MAVAVAAAAVVVAVVVVVVAGHTHNVESNLTCRSGHKVEFISSHTLEKITDLVITSNM